MNKATGITYTIGLALALIISLIVVTAVGYHILMNQKEIGYDVISARSLFVVKRLDGYYIKLIVTNEASHPVTIDKIVVTDGNKTLVFGDGGTEDHLTGLLDTLANQKITIQPGQTYVIQEYQETPSGFKLNPGITATIYYTIKGETHQLTVGGKASISVELGQNHQPPPPPPPPFQPGEFKVLFTSKKRNLTWQPITIPPYHYVVLKRSVYNGYTCYEVTTENSSDSGYDFLAYLPVEIPKNALLKVTGYVAVNDDFSGGVARTRRKGELYILDGYMPNKFGTKVIARYDDTDWTSFEYRNRYAYPVFLGLGRPDSWTTDWKLKLFFLDVKVYLNGKELTPDTTYQTNELIFQINGSVAPNLFIFNNPSGHLTITTVNGRKLPYSILYYSQADMVAWIDVKLPSNITLSSQTPYVIKVRYDKYGDNAVSTQWSWREIDGDIPIKIRMSRQTSVKYIGPSSSGIAVLTDSLYKETAKLLPEFTARTKPLRGLALAFTLTTSNPVINYLYYSTTNGMYKMVISTCNHNGEEIKIYKISGDSETLVKSIETGCFRNVNSKVVVELVSDENVPDVNIGTTQVSYFRVNINEPILWFNFTPVTGNNGLEILKIYAYTGSIQQGSNHIFFFNNVDVSYQRSS